MSQHLLQLEVAIYPTGSILAITQEGVAEIRDGTIDLGGEYTFPKRVRGHLLPADPTKMTDWVIGDELTVDNIGGGYVLEESSIIVETAQPIGNSQSGCYASALASDLENIILSELLGQTLPALQALQRARPNEVLELHLITVWDRKLVGDEPTYHYRGILNDSLPLPTYPHADVGDLLAT